MQTKQLNIVTALPCEARPFIDCLRLKLIENSSAFTIFKNKDGTIYLIVSGIGKINSAAAVSYLHAYTDLNTSSYFLNFGIAGGSERKIGELFHIHKLIDAATYQVFYPFPIRPGGFKCEAQHPVFRMTC